MKVLYRILFLFKYTNCFVAHKYQAFSLTTSVRGRCEGIHALLSVSVAVVTCESASVSVSVLGRGSDTNGRLLPDLVYSWESGIGTSSLSDDATSKDSCSCAFSISQVVSLGDLAAIDLSGEDGSADKGVSTTEVQEQVHLDLSVFDTHHHWSFFALDITDQASLRVSEGVDDTIPDLFQRVPDTTESCEVSFIVGIQSTIEDTFRLFQSTIGVDVKSDGALNIAARRHIVKGSSEG